MYRERSFLMGLGLGLIISSILVMIFSNSILDSGNKQTWSIAELKQAAAIQNAYLYTNEELEQLRADIKKEVLETNNLQTENTQENENLEKSKIEFVIKTGMNSDEVANYLESIGVIESKVIFNELLKGHDLTKKIIAGSYVYDDHFTLEEIIEIITNTKSENW